MPSEQTPVCINRLALCLCFYAVAFDTTRSSEQSHKEEVALLVLGTEHFVRTAQLNIISDYPQSQTVRYRRVNNIMCKLCLVLSVIPWFLASILLVFRADISVLPLILLDRDIL